MCSPFFWCFTTQFEALRDFLTRVRIVRSHTLAEMDPFHCVITPGGAYFVYAKGARPLDPKKVYFYQVKSLGWGYAHATATEDANQADLAILHKDSKFDTDKVLHALGEFVLVSPNGSVSNL